MACNGSTGIGSKKCNNAINAYKESLKIRTLDDFPIQYANTQSNLGEAYSTLAEVKDRSENCKKAIEAYEKALSVFTLDDFPIQYADTQKSLGAAYWMLAEVRDKSENCKKAIKAYEKALSVFIKEESPEICQLVEQSLRDLTAFCKGG